MLQKNKWNIKAKSPLLSIQLDHFMCLIYPKIKLNWNVLNLHGNYDEYIGRNVCMYETSVVISVLVYLQV